MTTLTLSRKQFGAYLAGIWEGDGSIWIPKTSHAPSGKRYTPHFSITFHDKDYPLVLALQQLIGGTIRNKSDNHAYVLTITSINVLQKIIYLINGYLRTPKIHRFNKLIKWINTNNPETSPIACNDVNISPILNNAWLSGFIDADGSFDVKVREIEVGRGKNRVEARLRIEQRQIDPDTGLSYDSVLESIALALEVKLKTSYHNEGIEYYSIAVTSPAKLAAIIKYLDRYPLYSNNQQAYLTQIKDFNYLEYSLDHYIAGLIEGDGSIKVPNSLRSDKNKLLYPSVTIVFVDKDLPLANALATYLKGTVNKAKGNYYVLSIYSLSALYNFAGMVNGKFKTPKIEALHRLITWLNNNGKFEPLELKGLDNSDIFSNSWFSGFSDCDSNFLITFNLTDNIAKNIQLTYRLSQKQDYQQKFSKGSYTSTTLFKTENIDYKDLNLSQTINPIINKDLNILKDERSYFKDNS
ncbi:hypothetical protein Clacol_010474 [Clathrus columnatus]|uniref:Homing endonuclease LAGLIDADG domain-containing protein n=1 Tax=Clathrus columnatus TaxID=1419009 RepID=A0AAV5ATX8_9AGAM|nr:hypothetical protein Clacol_010474 [Clathrus columnatus]